MAQYDYYEQPGSPGFWLDCQAELMEDFETRFVVPLLPTEMVPTPLRHLNPVFEIGEVPYTMATQYAGAIPASELRRKAGSLANRHYDIVRALDFLLSGI